MKILFYNHTGQVSGAEYMLLLIVGGLNTAKFDSVVVCPPNGGLRGKVEGAGIRCEPISDLQARFTLRPNLILRYLWSFWQTIQEFRRLVRREQPDLVHANSTRAGLVATAATIGLKIGVVWHLHDVLPAHPLSSLIRIFAVCFRRISMIAVSAATAAAFRGRILGNWLDVTVIHNGIDTKRFVRDRAGASKIRAEIGIDADALVFGIVGQLTARKGQLELLHAFANASRELPNSFLLVVGAAIFNADHEYQKQLFETADELGINDKTFFLGKRTDIAAVFSTLDLLVLNSRSEPFGLVLMEALATGTPVLATSVDGVPELITHGTTGWLVPPQNTLALTRALVKIGQQPDLRRTLGEKGREEVLTNFTAEKYIHSIEEYFNRRVAKNLLPNSARLVNRQSDSARF